MLQLVFVEELCRLLGQTLLMSAQLPLGGSLSSAKGLVRFSEVAGLVLFHNSWDVVNWPG